MPTTTANLGLTLPTPNVDTGWGSTLNTDFTLIDDLFAAGGTGTSVGLNVGFGKTLGISGTLLLGSGDGTGTTTAPTIRGAARTGTNVTGANLTIDAANGTGTGGSGSLIFRTAPTGVGGTTANSLVNSLVINNSGNVGIGTSSANQKLHIRSSGSVYAQIQCDNPAAGVGWYFSNTTKNWLIGSGPVSGGGEFAFYDATVGVERLQIGTAGQIGIGGANYGSAGQVLTSNGSGSSVSWSNPVTTSNVLSATAGANAGDVGTYGFLAKATPSAGNPGDLVAGSALRWTNANGGLGTAPAGTWRLMGLAGTGVSGSPTLWLRIS